MHWLSRPPALRVIVALHFVLLLGLYAHQGILVDKEALKYIGCAEETLGGDPHNLLGNYLKYSSYILFLLPFVALGAPKAAVLAQVALTVAAGFALRRMVLRSTAHEAIGTMALAIYMLTPFIQAWTLALYTEAFFTSVCILFIERALAARKLDPWSLGLGLITLLARPVGLLFVGAAIIWKCTRSHGSLWRGMLRSAGCLVLFIFAISIPGIRQAQLEPIVSQQVIAGVGGTHLADTSFTGTSVLSAQLFLLETLSPSAWVELAVRRMTSLFTTTRPYFSTAHNGVNAVLYLLYPLALLGVLRHPRSTLPQLLFAIIALNTALIGLTHDEWSGRFLVPLLPWVIVLSSMGLDRLIARSNKHNGPTDS